MLKIKWKNIQSHVDQLTCNYWMIDINDMNLNIKQIYTQVTCRMFKINIKIQQTSPKSILVLPWIVK
jgi:azurin